MKIIRCMFFGHKWMTKKHDDKVVTNCLFCGVESMESIVLCMKSEALAAWKKGRGLE